MPQRAIKTKAPAAPSRRFQMSIPDDELEDVELTVKRIERLRAEGKLVLSKSVSAAKVIRVALRQLLGTTTTEQLAELLETTDL